MSVQIKKYEKITKILFCSIAVFIAIFLFQTSQVNAQSSKKMELSVISPIEKISPKSEVANSPVWGNELNRYHGLTEDGWTHISAEDVYKLESINQKYKLTAWPFSYLGKKYRGRINLGHTQTFGSLGYSVEKLAEDGVTVVDEYKYNYQLGTGRTARETPFDTISGRGKLPYVGRTSDQPLYPNTQGFLAELHYQAMEVNGEITKAFQVRAFDPSEVNPYKKIETRKTFVPLKSGGVRIYIECKREKNLELGRDVKIGFMESIDTELNGVDKVPVYNYEKGEGAYISNIFPGEVVSGERESFKVIFTYPKDEKITNDGIDGRLGFTEYEAAAFVQASRADGNLAGDSIFKNAIDGKSNTKTNVKDAQLFANQDSAVNFKWNARSVAPGEVRTMAMDILLKRMSPPIFKLNQNAYDLKAESADTIKINGNWLDYDSYEVALYMRVSPVTGNPESYEWKKLENANFSNKSLGVSQDWEYNLPINKIGKPSKNKYKVEFRMKDIPGDDFSTTPQSFLMKIDRNSKVITKYIDEKGNELEAEKVDIYSIDSENYKTNSLNLEKKGYDYIGWDKTSDLANGKIVDGDLEVRYIYKKRTINVIINHRKNSIQNTPFNTERKIVKVGEEYTTSPLNEYDSISGNDAIWNGVTPWNHKDRVPLEQQEDIMVDYVYNQGKVKIIEASDINFNELKMSAFGSEKYYTDKPLTMKIKDQRKDKQLWKINLTLEKDFTKRTGAKFKDTLNFKRTDKNEIFPLREKETREIYSQKSPSLGDGPIDTVIEWDGKNKEGLFMKLSPGVTAEQGAYEAVLKWTLVDAP